MLASTVSLIIVLCLCVQFAPLLTIVAVKWHKGIKEDTYRVHVLGVRFIHRCIQLHGINCISIYLHLDLKLNLNYSNACTY